MLRIFFILFNIIPSEDAMEQTYRVNVSRGGFLLKVCFKNPPLLSYLKCVIRTVPLTRFQIPLQLKLEFPALALLRALSQLSLLQ